jgi:hypothetical protein
MLDRLNAQAENAGAASLTTYFPVFRDWSYHKALVPKLFERRLAENCKHAEAPAISHLQRVFITFELLIQAFEVIPSLCHLSNCNGSPSTTS